MTALILMLLASPADDALRQAEIEAARVRSLLEVSRCREIAPCPTCPRCRPCPQPEPCPSCPKIEETVALECLPVVPCPVVHAPPPAWRWLVAGGVGGVVLGVVLHAAVGR
jgi:hypothetical protein